MLEPKILVKSLYFDMKVGELLPRNSFSELSRLLSYDLLASTPTNCTLFCDTGVGMLHTSPLLACSLLGSADRRH